MNPTVRQPDRSEIAGFLDEAKRQRRGKQTHVRARVEVLYPELVGLVIRRNGQTYDAIEYLLKDLDSHA